MNIKTQGPPKTDSRNGRRSPYLSDKPECPNCRERRDIKTISKLNKSYLCLKCGEKFRM